MVLTLPAEVYVDHPFIFLICGRGTGAVLFLGWEKSGGTVVVGSVSSRPLRCKKPWLRASGATALLPKV